MNPVGRKNEFFNEVKAKGITVINGPKTAFGRHRIVSPVLPVEYALTYSGHVKDVPSDARVTGVREFAHQVTLSFGIRWIQGTNFKRPDSLYPAKDRGTIL